MGLFDDVRPPPVTMSVYEGVSHRKPPKFVGPFHHGTHHDFDELKSSWDAGAEANYDYNVFSEPDRNRKFFMTAGFDDSLSEEDPEHRAWLWSHQKNAKGGRRRVYRVEPNPDVTLEYDDFVSGAVKGSGSGARVVDTSWIPTTRHVDWMSPRPTPWGVQAVQGTLPPYNWNKTARSITESDQELNWEAIPASKPGMSAFEEAIRIPEGDENWPPKRRGELPGQERLF